MDQDAAGWLGVLCCELWLTLSHNPSYFYLGTRNYKQKHNYDNNITQTKIQTSFIKDIKEEEKFESKIKGREAFVNCNISAR